MFARGVSLCLLATVLAVPARGQDRANLCSLTSAGETRRVIENGEEIILLEDSFVAVCPDGEELRANSGRINSTTRDVYLLGNVFFRDSVQTLTSNEATYNPNTARLWARGDVVYSNERQGTTLRGPELEYLRATESRPIPQMTATRRPTLTMPPAEGADPPEPLDLTADRVEMTGEDQLFAFGDVVITRADLRATSGEARYNSSTEELALRLSAVIRSEAFELLGDSVDARLASGKLDFLHSRVDARLVGEDLRVAGDDLQLLFADDLLQRVVAVARPGGARQASATSASFELQADSLDALLVDQRLEEVYAIGNAFGASIDTTSVDVDPFASTETEQTPAAEAALFETDADAAQPPEIASPPDDVLARDWIRGDTIIGYFVQAGGERVEPAEQQPEGAELEPPAADESLVAGGAGPDGTDPVADDVADTTEEARQSVELERLVAIGSAQSLYRMPVENEELGPDARNVNFLVGRRIELQVGGGELRVANVEGLQYGVYLEALPPESEEAAEDEAEEQEPEEPDAAGEGGA